MSPSPKKAKKKPNITGKTRKVQTWSVTQKLEVIEMRENGAKWVRIALEKGMDESTARSIYAKRDEVRARGKILFSWKTFKRRKQQIDCLLEESLSKLAGKS